MGKGLERVTLPTPQEGFDPQDEAQFRRALERFMATADGRVREVDEDLDTVQSEVDAVETDVAAVETDVADHESRISALEGSSEGHGLTLVEAQSPSGVSEVTFTTDIDDTYEEYLISVLNVIPATDARLRLETSSDGGSTWDTGASDYGVAVRGIDTAGGTDENSNSTGRAQIPLTANNSDGAATPLAGVSLSIRAVNPADTGRHTVFHWTGAYLNGSGNFHAVWGTGRRLEAAVVDAIRLRFSSGNIESGEVKLYGVIKS